MKQAEIIAIIVISYGIAPFASILTNIYPVAGNILLFSCLGIVLGIALCEIIRYRLKNAQREAISSYKHKFTKIEEEDKNESMD